MRLAIVFGSLAFGLMSAAQAQAPNAALLDTQRQAMSKLAFLDGEWAGPAVSQERTGPLRMTQTERSGTLLEGTVRLVEGRAYDPAGKTLFNALAMISYDARAQKYLITSHASGYATTTELEVRADGFDWAVPAGPGRKMRFKAMIKDGSWTETGELVLPNGSARRTFSMTVKRLRSTSWPAGSSVSYR